MPEPIELAAIRKAAASERSLHPLAARGLTYEAGGARLIDGIDCKLDREAITVILGFNGAGKSLLVRLLHGMIQPAAGSVTWDGEAMMAAHRMRQAMVFQKPVLLRRSVAANVDFVLRSRGLPAQRRDEVLERVGLAGMGKRPARLLSGGEQQRLALARALACEPEVLFLDEATASLDPASVAAIEAIVRDAHESGTKIVMITHNAGQARRLAGEVIFIHRGRIAEQGEAGAFFAGPASKAARAYLEGHLPDEIRHSSGPAGMRPGP